MKHDYSIQTLCENLDVSPSGYYDWQERRVSPCARALENQALTEQIKAIHGESRRTYGSPRIRARLREQGQRHRSNRIARLMKQAGLSGRQKDRYRVKTTDSNHDEPIAPNQIWVADITYVPTAEGWLYLAAILDRYSRKIVGWAMSERIDTALVLDALRMALQYRQPPAAAAAALRSRRPVRLGRVPHGPGTGRLDRLDESSRQLLRQRGHGKFLEHSETRIDLPP